MISYGFFKINDKEKKNKHGHGEGNWVLKVRILFHESSFYIAAIFCLWIFINFI